jgi:hypothetical protein
MAALAACDRDGAPRRGRRRRASRGRGRLPLALQHRRPLLDVRRGHRRPELPAWRSQIALPKETCDLVYSTEGYAQSVQNLAQTSLDTDNVFSDGYASQLATTSGAVDSGIAIKLNVGV